MRGRAKNGSRPRAWTDARCVAVPHIHSFGISRSEEKNIAIMYHSLKEDKRLQRRASAFGTAFRFVMACGNWLFRRSVGA